MPWYASSTVKAISARVGGSLVVDVVGDADHVVVERRQQDQPVVVVVGDQADRSVAVHRDDPDRASGSQWSAVRVGR